MDIINEIFSSLNWLKLFNFYAKNLPNPGCVDMPLRWIYRLFTFAWINERTYYIPDFVIFNPLKSILIFLYDWNLGTLKIVLRFSSFSLLLIERETSKVDTPYLFNALCNLPKQQISSID